MLLLLKEYNIVFIKKLGPFFLDTLFAVLGISTLMCSLTTPSFVIPVYNLETLILEGIFIIIKEISRICNGIIMVPTNSKFYFKLLKLPLSPPPVPTSFI